LSLVWTRQHRDHLNDLISERRAEAALAREDASCRGYGHEFRHKRRAQLEVLREVIRTLSGLRRPLTKKQRTTSRKGQRP
jgi:hypothetical protein